MAQTIADLATNSASENALNRNISSSVLLASIPDVEYDVRMDPDFDATAFSNRLRSAASSFTEGALPPEEIDPSTAEKLHSTLRMSNMLVSMFSRERVHDNDDSPRLNTDYLIERIEKDGLQQFRMKFIDVNTEAEYETMKAQLEREQRDRDIAASMGFWESVPYELLAAASDPTSYLPVAGILGKTGKTASRALRAPAQRVGAIAAGQAVASEAALTATQELRTLEESIANIAFSTLLSAIIGGGAHHLLERAKVRTERLDHLHGDLGDLMTGKYNGTQVQNLSAALVDQSLIRHVNTAQAPTGTMLQAWERFNDFFLRRPFGLDFEGMRNPEVEMLGSRFAPVRRVALQLLNTSRITQDNARGIANPTGRLNVSDIVRDQQARLATAQQATNELFRSTGGGRVAIRNGERLISKSDKYGSAQEMSKRVYRAMINGEQDVDGDAAITALAKIWRKEVFDPILEQLREAGILKGDGFESNVNRTALGYVTRIYNKEAILRDKGGFEDEGSFLNIARNYFYEQLDIDRLELQRKRDAQANQKAQKESDAAEFLERETADEKLIREAKLRELKQEEQGKIEEIRSDSKSKMDDAVSEASRARECITKNIAQRRKLAKDKKARDKLTTEGAKQKTDANKQRDRKLAKLREDQIKAEQKVRDDFKAKADKIRKLSDEKINSIKAEAKTIKGRYERQQSIAAKLKSSDAMLQEAERLAQRTRVRILGETGDYLDYEVTTGVRGFEKSRSFLIEDKILADAGFLMDDLFEIANRYSRTAGADAALAKVFRQERKVKTEDGSSQFAEVPDYGLEQVKRDLRDTVAQDIQNKRELGTLGETEEADVLNELARAEQVIDERVALFRGTFSSRFQDARLDEMARAARLLNYFRLMGGTVLSSIADISALTLVNGFGPTVTKGVLPLLKEYRANWGKAWIDGDKLARSEMRRHSMLAGANMELVLNSRVAAMASIETEGSIAGLSQSFQREMSGRFSKISGITYWNSMIKQVAYNTTQSRVLDDAAKGWRGLSKREQTWLSNLGIDQGTLSKFRDAHQAQAKQDEFGIPFGRFDEWSDQELASKFKAALSRETTNMIVTPERAELPTFYNTPHGQLMLQFRSHMLLSQAKIVNRNAQLAGQGAFLDGGAGYAIGMTGMLMFGVLVDALKFGAGFVTLDGETKDKGQNPIEQYINGWQDNPTRSFFNSLDRATVTPIFADLDGIMNKMTGLGLRGVVASQTDKSAFTEEGKPARLRNRSPLDVLAGPTAGLLGDLAATASSTGQAALSLGEITPSRAQFKAARRMLPGQNIPGFQQLGNAAEQYLADEFEWPEPK